MVKNEFVLSLCNNVTRINVSRVFFIVHMQNEFTIRIIYKVFFYPKVHDRDVPCFVGVDPGVSLVLPSIPYSGWAHPSLKQF